MKPVFLVQEFKHTYLSQDIALVYAKADKPNLFANNEYTLLMLLTVCFFIHFVRYVFKDGFTEFFSADMLLTTAAEISPATQETILTTVALSQTTESIGNFTKTTGGPITVTEACLFNVQV